MSKKTDIANAHARESQGGAALNDANQLWTSIEVPSPLGGGETVHVERPGQIVISSRRLTESQVKKLVDWFNAEFP